MYILFASLLFARFGPKALGTKQGNEFKGRHWVVLHIISPLQLRGSLRHFHPGFGNDSLV